MCPCIVVQMMSKMDGHYIKAFLRFVGCCCGPVADTHVFYHLGYNDGLYFGSNFCPVGHSSGCVLDDCSSMVYPFDVCNGSTGVAIEVMPIGFVSSVDPLMSLSGVCTSAMEASSSVIQSV